MKNLFVAAPLVFAKRLNDLPQALRALAAVALFCALSSAVYLWNDLIDLEKDRAHPRKSKRPIASGRLSVQTAKISAGVLAAGALALGALLDIDFALVAGGYLMLNVLYSLVLKKIVYLDVLSIAGGFLLRVLAGAMAVRVWTSPYLLICTGLISCYLGFGKRAHELLSAGDRAEKQRNVLASYNPALLRVALYVTGAATFASYVAYTLAEHTRQFFHSERMIFTAPFVAFGMLRFGWLVTRKENADSPTDAMLHDLLFMSTMALWAVSVTLIIYFKV
jgi:decaprenyl-phosphate phosphoribosyltransferase